MLVLKRLLAIVIAGVFAACAVQPSAEKTRAQKVAFEEDEDAHLPKTEEKSEDAEASKSRVRVTKNTSSKDSTKVDNTPVIDEKNEENEDNPPLEDKEDEMKEEIAEDEEPEVLAGPLVALQAPAAPQNFNLLTQNTISVPVTAAAAGTAVFTIDRSALDLVDLAGDITISAALPTLSFAAAGEVKMLNINVNITAKNPAVGAQSFTLVATPTGQEPIELPLSFTVEQRIDFEVSNVRTANAAFTSGGQALAAGDNIDVKDGTMISFTNTDPNETLRVHMAGGYHQGDAIPDGESYVPAQDFCGEAGRDNQIFYDHNSQSGNDARMITCIDRAQ